MQIPVQVAFHGINKSDFVEVRIRDRFAKLENFFDRIAGCCVAVESHHRSHSSMNVKAAPFHISAHLSVSGDELVVRRDPKETKVHEHTQIGIRDTLDTMERRLKDYA
ncbi:MAG: HPF/RaiA family ribosome-associated protein [Rhodospirillaceae bacterium]|jgi:putative sigma-54 modulation protein|nr:HPF/RaiA family ribosome-associated protein [Rhodospirillaceae bacterium]